MSPVQTVLAAVSHPALDPHKSQGLILTSARISAWIRAGADLDEIIIPTIQRIMSRKNGYDRISSWGYFDQAIKEAVGKKVGIRAMHAFAEALKIPVRVMRESDRDAEHVPGKKSRF